MALLSITACGTGLNLTRANVALFGELNWSLGELLNSLYAYLTMLTLHYVIIIFVRCGITSRRPHT